LRHLQAKTMTKGVIGLKHLLEIFFVTIQVFSRKIS